MHQMLESRSANLRRHGLDGCEYTVYKLNANDWIEICFCDLAYSSRKQTRKKTETEIRHHVSVV